MTKLPSMPFFPADFFADTEHLSPSARHAYLFLLCHAWLRGAKLPNDDAALARMAGFRLDQWRKLKQSVMEFWKLGPDGFLRNPRQHINFETVHTTREINKANGVHGGRPKSLFSKTWTKPTGFFSETETKGYQNQNQNIKEDSLNGEIRQRSGSGSDAGHKLVYIKAGTEQWNAWENFYRKSRRKLPKNYRNDPDGGWHFPTEWPPDSTKGTS